MRDPEIEAVLDLKFAPAEAREILDFLELLGFSKNGEIAVVSIFLYAQEHRKQMSEVIEACKSEWQRNWRYQHPRIRGDLNAPDEAGAQNRASLDNIYRALEIPNPSQEGMNVPKEQMLVKTRYSTYRLGPADENGERDITRDGKALPYKRCIVTFLFLGKEMRCTWVADFSRELCTSAVESIIVGLSQ